MKKYVWEKKKEYISEAEFYNSRFLYNQDGKIVMISFYAKKYDEKTDSYKHNSEEFYKYLFTEEEVKEKLPNSYHMFQPTVMGIDTSSVYGEIKGDKE